MSGQILGVILGALLGTCIVATILLSQILEVLRALKTETHKARKDNWIL